jgi:DNA-binding response OmpR family regulator
VSRITLVEDEEAVAESLVYGLELSGHTVEVIGDGLDALERLLVDPPDLLILDLMLPSLNGLEVCRRISKHHPSLPILILSAKGEPDDRVTGLEAGAEDYVVKPFSLREVQARVEILLRRVTTADDGDFLCAGPFRLDRAASKFFVSKREVHLPRKEMALMTLLMQNVGRVVSRDDLVCEVWGADFVGDPKTLGVHLRWLREKIESDPSNPKYLKTVRGRGFRLDV